MLTCSFSKFSLFCHHTYREQKLHEAEERRKKDEEMRKKKMKANEAEQRRVAEALARRREAEEAERHRKVSSIRRTNSLELKFCHFANGKFAKFKFCVLDYYKSFNGSLHH